jgi:hypothetical protein
MATNRARGIADGTMISAKGQVEGFSQFWRDLIGAPIVKVRAEDDITVRIVGGQVEASLPQECELFTLGYIVISRFHV